MTSKEKEIIDLIFSGASNVYLKTLKKRARNSTYFYNKWKKINKILYDEALSEKLYEGDKMKAGEEKKSSGLQVLITFLLLLVCRLLLLSRFQFSLFICLYRAERELNMIFWIRQVEYIKLKEMLELLV